MNQPKLLIEYYPTTTLFTDFLISVLGFHVFTRKDTLLKLKTNTILRKQFRKELTFNLLYKLVNGISESKITFECRMSMQI
jgi:hypothetical protein